MVKSNTPKGLKSRAKELRSVRASRIPPAKLKAGARMLYDLAMGHYVSSYVDRSPAQDLAKLLYVAAGGKV